MANQTTQTTKEDAITRALQRHIAFLEKTVEHNISKEIEFAARGIPNLEEWHGARSAAFELEVQWLKEIIEEYGVIHIKPKMYVVNLEMYDKHKYDYLKEEEEVMCACGYIVPEKLRQLKTLWCPVCGEGIWVGEGDE